MVTRVALAFFILVFSALPQGTTSRLQGVVVDSSAAIVGGATVTLKNEGTNAVFETKTTAAGAYVFESVPSGRYTVLVESPGFKKFTARNNAVSIGQPTTVNVTLQLGAVTETVEVSGAYEAVQTSTSGNMGNLLEEKIIKDLPIVGTRGRNPLDLVLIQPGITSGSNTGGGIHVHGARDRAWNYTLDGIDTNETSAGGSNFSPIRANPDSLAEFRVITGNFTADSGRNSGAQVAMVTKSGTNDLHGSGFWFYRTPRFNANEWENNLDNLGKRQFVQTIFGGSLGGPIRKNQTFFFANGQGLRALETAQVTRSVYTQSMRQGIYRYNRTGRNLPAGVAGASVDPSGNPLGNIGSYNIFQNDPQRIGADRSIAALIAATPLPNRFDFGDGLNTAGYTFVAPQNERQHDITFKIDHIFDPQNTVSLRYSFGRQDTNCDRVNGGAPIFPGTTCLVDTERTPSNLAVNWRTNPTTTVTNEFVIGFNQFEFFFNQPLASLTNPSLSSPVDLIANYSFGNNRRVRTAQIVDNLSWVTGKHSLKFGVNIRLQRQNDDRGTVGGFNANPSVNFSTALNPVDPRTFGLPADVNQQFDLGTLQGHTNFLLGRVGQRSQGFISQGDRFVAGRFDFVTDYPEYDLYIQDTYKLRRNFSIDLGLRLEMKPAPSNVDNRIRRPDQLFVHGAAPQNSATWVPGQLHADRMNNFGPSVGFAWDPFGTGKTSVRSNYRIAYDRMPTFLLASTIFPNMPGETFGLAEQQFGINGGRLATMPALTAPTANPRELATPAPFGAAGVTVVDPNLKIPTTHQWSFSLQREVFRNTVIEASYIGRRGYNLFGAYNANQSDIFANGFLAGFNEINAGGQSAVINRALAGDSRIQAGETASSMIRRLFPGDLRTGNVAGLASGLATRIQNGRSVTAISGAGPFFFNPVPQFGSVVTIDSNDFSTYHALELTFERRLSKGFYLNANYTWSKSLDTRSFDPVFTTAASGAAQSASSTPFDIRNRRGNYGISDFNRTHVYKTTWSYELPFGRGARFLSAANGVVDRLLGGWRASGILTIASGRPFTVFSGVNTVSNAVQSTAVCTGCTADMGRAFTDPGQGFVFYFDQTERGRFKLDGGIAGQQGNTPRNFFTGDGQFNLDASLQKDVSLREGLKLEIRADATNLSNTPTFGFPTTTANAATFGRIRNTVASSSRKIQLGARITF
ncbi:MAG: carboxypeptidase regulatory-like domain-containing protein [Acidobacteriota bacterium]